MRPSRGSGRVAGLALLLTASVAWTLPASAAGSEDAGAAETRIDLPTVLRLAGARNLDIQIARQRLEEARARHRAAVQEFFPWLSPGIAYRRHDGLTQGTEGEIVDVHKYSYSPGAVVAAGTDVGRALFRSREARRLVTASERGVAARRADTLFSAVELYFDLARAQAALGVAEDAVRISRDYEQQLQRAVAIGIAFKGDQLRVHTQVKRDEVGLQQARATERVTAARLAELLYLDPKAALTAEDTELLPLSIVDEGAPAESLIDKAMTARPEIGEADARVAAFRDARDGAVIGPLIPSVGVAAFLGGLGGGRRNVPGEFGPSWDYAVTVGWRVGPGGLFDSGRLQESRARLEGARLEAARTRQGVVREVVEALTRVRSFAEQIATTKEGLSAATETLRLSQERKEFGVANVIEYILAAQDLTRARTEYLSAVADYDKAQYALLRAIGGIEGGAPSAPPLGQRR